MFKRAGKYLKQIVIAFFFTAWLTPAFSSENPRLRIALLTCSPGDDLYSIFGHSAFRITDSSSGSDIVFNFGTFNFNEEDFYLKFMRGKLRYYLSTEYFPDFRSAYYSEFREIREQELNLNAEEKKTLYLLLLDNLSDEKKYYLYDFFLDNCTTRLRDLILASKKPEPELGIVMPASTTFRQAIHQYLDKGKKQWSKLGIDILLGAKTDAIMTASQQQFLPDNLMTAVDSCKNVSLVSGSNVFPAAEKDAEEYWFTPMLFFSSLLLFVLLIHLPGKKRSPIAEGLENFILFMTGLLGIILVLMWLGTDHKMTKDNYNLLWAWPSHAVAVLTARDNRWTKTYFRLYAIFQILLLGAWAFLSQDMNEALLPFIILLIFLSYRRTIKP